MPGDHVAYLITVLFQVSESSNKLEPSFLARWHCLSCEQEELEMKVFFILRSFPPGQHPKQIFLRMPNCIVVLVKLARD